MNRNELFNGWIAEKFTLKTVCLLISFLSMLGYDRRCVKVSVMIYFHFIR